jgi:hypothetical protein
VPDTPPCFDLSSAEPCEPADPHGAEQPGRCDASRGAPCAPEGCAPAAQQGRSSPSHAEPRGRAEQAHEHARAAHGADDLDPASSAAGAAQTCLPALSASHSARAGGAVPTAAAQRLLEHAAGTAAVRCSALLRNQAVHWCGRVHGQHCSRMLVRCAVAGDAAESAGEAPAAARAAEDAAAEAADGAEPPLLLVTTVAISTDLSDRIELRLGDCPLARPQAAPPTLGRSATAPGVHGLSWEPHGLAHPHTAQHLPHHLQPAHTRSCEAQLHSARSSCEASAG